LCKSPAAALAEAIRYALSRWTGLTRFLHDGRIELDTNPVERAIRPIALGRKNRLFAVSDGGGDRWASHCRGLATKARRHRGRPAKAMEATVPAAMRCGASRSIF
jgi:hypothetical protein